MFAIHLLNGFAYKNSLGRFELYSPEFRRMKGDTMFPQLRGLSLKIRGRPFRIKIRNFFTQRALTLWYCQSERGLEADLLCSFKIEVNTSQSRRKGLYRLLFLMFLYVLRLGACDLQRLCSQVGRGMIIVQGVLQWLEIVAGGH